MGFDVDERRPQHAEHDKQDDAATQERKRQPPPQRCA
jgi:hypothetical protein